MNSIKFETFTFSGFWFGHFYETIIWFQPLLKKASSLNTKDQRKCNNSICELNQKQNACGYYLRIDLHYFSCL